VAVSARFAAALACLCLLPVESRADGPALWQLEGQRNRVYLFGSIHLLRPGEFRIEGELALAYGDAEAVYLEVDLAALSPSMMAAAVAELAIDPQGRTLDELMGEDAHEAYVLARGAGIELATLGHVEPWFAALTVMSLALAREGLSGEDGVEQQVIARAAADGKEIHGLETLEEQLGVLDAMGSRQQREFLLKSLEDARQVPAAVQTLLAAWRTGDEATLTRELATEFTDEPDLYRSLIVERNRRWAEQIVALLDHEEDYLVIVGALHLVGEDGLPAVLERRGFEVSRR
jgi:uncharacterized protein YbaP (TraB family)